MVANTTKTIHRILDCKRRKSLASFGYSPCTTRALATAKHTELQAWPICICDRKNCGKLSTVIFRILFDEAMLRNIRKCTVVETLCISDKINWDVTLDELDKFIGLIIARGILGQRDLPVEGLWQSTWAFPMFNNTLSRHRFKKIMRFLSFDVKSNKRQRVIHDKFCLVFSL